MPRQFNPYSQFRTEPNMREEFTNTMDGSFPEIAKKQTLVYRKMRISDNGELVPCSCVDDLTKEADKDTYCPVCLGERYLWDELFVDGYKQVIRSSVGLSTKEQLIGPGLTNTAYVSFFFEYNIPVTLIANRPSPDKIVEIFLDESGKPIRPYKRQTIYRIGTAIDFRSDNAKLEYWKLDCYEEQVKFLNGPKG